MTKFALITGGNRGLGYETARLLGEKGFHVIIGSRDAENGSVAANQLVRIGIDASSLQIDVTVDRSTKAAAAEVEERFGRLDLLINNAGILPEATEVSGGGPIDLKMFRKTFDTNLFGAIAGRFHDRAGQESPRVRYSGELSLPRMAPDRSGRRGQQSGSPDDCHSGRRDHR